MKLFTIGFTKKSAEEFFEAIRASGVRHVIDVRLKNTSHLAGFAKRNDLVYFLDRLLGVQYHHLTAFAPPEDLLAAYRKDGDWQRYEDEYNKLLHARNPERSIDPSILEERAVLLCSEPTAEHCHRRLAADYLRAELAPGADIIHL